MHLVIFQLQNIQCYSYEKRINIYIPVAKALLYPSAVADLPNDLLTD